MKQPAVIIIVVAMLLSPLLLMIDRTDTKEPESTPSSSTSASSTALTRPDDAVTAKKVTLQTTKGDIVINLFSDITPNAASNFATLGKRGYYNNVVFHRVVKDFMIQSGDPTGTGSGGTSMFGRAFPNEENPDRKFKAGSVGMANSGRDTNGSQFFIMTEQEYPSLDGGYTLFGEVADEASMAVVRSIAAVEVKAQSDDPNAEISRPVNLDDVKITGFSIIE